MRLAVQVAQVWADQARLARALPHHRPRAGQQLMAQAVSDAIDDDGVLVVEAGTGVGKTYAYLIPVLLSGEKAIVSTATKALQDQLARRDVPRLLDALGLAARVAVLKGRSSYLCIHRLERARQSDVAFDTHTQRDLAQVESWAPATQTGDLAELPTLDENAEAVALVTSTRENCLGGRCNHWEACHVNVARRLAQEADLVVANHHLFFADHIIRETGVAELLPQVRTLVLDEAHQLNEIGLGFLGRCLDLRSLERLSNELQRDQRLLARCDRDWIGKLQALAHALEKAKAHVQSLHDANASPSTDSGLQDLYTALAACEPSLRGVEESGIELGDLRRRMDHFLAELQVFAADPGPDTVRWLEGGTQPVWVQTPLTVATALRNMMQTAHTQKQSWVLTSATLGHEPGLADFVQTMGLEGKAQVLQVPSPFDYAQHSALYVPAHFPSPGGPAHSLSVARLVAQAVRVLQGRTLVLTTSLRAMCDIADELRLCLTLSTDPSVRVQGETSKRILADALRAQGRSAEDERGMVLVACAAFWEGIDVPGDALQLVVIDKLPFSPPDDPVMQARARQIKATGGNAFMQLHVAQAALALKQGAGRLLRSETDRGVLVVCDARLRNKSYGKKLLAALPPMPQLDSEAAFLQALQGLTKPSTTAY